MFELTPFRLLIDRVIPAARPYFRKIIPTVGLPIVLAATVLALMQDRSIQQMAAMGEDAVPGTNFWLMFGLLMGFVFILLIFYLLSYLALSHASMDAVRGRPVDMGKAWRFAVSLRVLWTMFLTTALTVIGFFLCIVPGLVIWPLLSMTLPVMIEEKIYGVEAIKRSFQIVRWNPTGRTADSNFLQVSCLLFVGWLIQNAVSSAAQLPAAILQMYWIFRQATGGTASAESLDTFVAPLWLQMPTQVLAALAVAVTWFYWTFGFAMLYSEFERRRTAPKLQEAIHRLTAAPQGPDSPGPAVPPEPAFDAPS